MGLLLIDNEYLPQANALVDGAKKTIDVSMFKAEMNSQPRGRRLLEFFEKLFNKAKSGVRVRFLINWHDDRRSVAKTNFYAMRELKNRNVKVRYLKANRCCHAKLLIVDNEKAILGSHNLSVRSCHNNFEVSYVLPDPESVKSLSSVFEKSFYDGQDA